MSVFLFVLSLIAAVTSCSLTILYLVKREFSETRRQVIHLYAELKQDLSEQRLQIEILKRNINKRSVTLKEVLKEPWVQDLLKED